LDLTAQPHKYVDRRERQRETVDMDLLHQESDLKFHRDSEEEKDGERAREREVFE